MFWFAFQLTGFLSGVRWQAAQPDVFVSWAVISGPSLVRATAILPVFLGRLGTAGTALLWGAVLLANVLAGATESADQSRRAQAVINQSWAPATVVEHRGVAVVRITGWARPGNNGRWRAPARILAWAAAESVSTFGPMPQTGQGISLTGQKQSPLPGCVLTAAMRLKVPPQASLTGGFDYRQFLAGRGLHWQARMDEYKLVAAEDPTNLFVRDFIAPVRHAILARLQLLLPTREAELASAVLLGQRTADSRAISAPFTVLGMAHLFAVSGLHVGILLGIVLLPGRALGLSPRNSVWPLWLFLPLYLILTGLPGSVVRAGGMGLVAAMARPLGRRVDTLRLLGLLYWVGSLLDPTQNQDTGLQLSYLAAAGILLLSRITDGFNFTANRWLNPWLTGLAVSFAAQWFTLPIVARSFGQISLLSPLANLVTVPLFGLAIWAVVSGLAASIVWLPLGQDLAAIAWLLLRSINGGVAWFAQLTGGQPWGLGVPGLAQDIGWFVLTAMLLALLRWRQSCRRRWPLDMVAWGLLPVLLLQLSGPMTRNLPAQDSIVFWQFDVGQGDCGLLVFPDGWTAVIDTGGRYGHRAPPSAGPLSRSILPFLRREGIEKVDAVLLTHGHLDHTGGAIALSEAVTVGQWHVAGRAAEAIAGRVDSTAVTRSIAGTILHSWQDWQLVVHYPLPGQTHAEGENNWSLVVALSQAGQTEMVWSGDLELAGEATLLAADSHLAPTRVLKAGHHGSNTSGSPGLMARLQPELVLISCGVGNRYGHPSHGPFITTVETQSDTVSVLRTDTQGSIRLEWLPDGQMRWRTRHSKGQLGRSP